MRTVRKLHKWLGLLFLFSALIISIVAIHLAFDGVLHFNKVLVAVPIKATQYAQPKLKASVATNAGFVIGTKRLCICNKTTECCMNGL